MFALAICQTIGRTKTIGCPFDRLAVLLRSRIHAPRANIIEGRSQGAYP